MPFASDTDRDARPAGKVAQILSRPEALLGGMKRPPLLVMYKLSDASPSYNSVPPALRHGDVGATREPPTPLLASHEALVGPVPSSPLRCACHPPKRAGRETCRITNKRG
jgi:hypothetical protein